MCFNCCYSDFSDFNMVSLQLRLCVCVWLDANQISYVSQNRAASALIWSKCWKSVFVIDFDLFAIFVDSSE